MRREILVGLVCLALGFCVSECYQAPVSINFYKCEGEPTEFLQEKAGLIRFEF